MKVRYKVCKKAGNKKTCLCKLNYIWIQNGENYSFLSCDLYMVSQLNILLHKEKVSD